MAANQITSFIQHIRTMELLRDGSVLTDGQLLGCYIEQRDDAAFAALVRQHGPMVWGVCRRLLHQHDAEDAFQATFLVLVRKAASIVPRERVANWLYGVAHQTALQARRNATRRRAREKQVMEMPESAVAEQDRWHDLHPLLDQELSRLPATYREVIVLCDLEGKTRKEVARQLGLPEGTVGSRLARARTMLAKRLARHGLAVSGGALAAILSQKVATAGVPTSVASSTIKAASLLAAGREAGVISVKVAVLTEGVVKAMFVTKIKSVLAVFLMIVGVVGVGSAGLWAIQPATPTPPEKGEAKNNPNTAPRGFDINKQEIKPALPAADEKGPTEVVVWGQEAGGLQAGVGLRPGSDKSRETGGLLQLVVKVRNVGKSPVTIKHLAAPFDAVRPTVQDEGGEGVRVFMPVRVSRARLVVEKSLKPGEEVEVGNGEAAVGPDGKLTPLHLPELLFADPNTMPPLPQVGHPTVYVPIGVYRVSYSGFLQTRPTLRTGVLKIEVGSSGVKKK